MSGVRATAAGPASYEARLARRVLLGGASAPQAAMTLLECHRPETIEAAAALLGEHGRVSVAAFDCLADAWATYQHLKDLGWD